MNQEMLLRALEKVDGISWYSAICPAYADWSYAQGNDLVAKYAREGAYLVYRPNDKVFAVVIGKPKERMAVKVACNPLAPFWQFHDELVVSIRKAITGAARQCA